MANLYMGKEPIQHPFSRTNNPLFIENDEQKLPFDSIDLLWFLKIKAVGDVKYSN